MEKIEYQETPNTLLEVKEYYNDLDKKIMEEYNRGIIFNRIYRNLYVLKKESSKIDFQSSYNMRPDLVSYEYLGLKNAGWIIMLMNNCNTIYNFTNDKMMSKGILIPSIEALDKILGDDYAI